MFENIVAKSRELAELAIGYLGDPSVYYQLIIITLLFVLAWLLSIPVEKRLEAWARGLKGKRELLRVIVAFLRRMEWFFFTLLLGAARILTGAVEWPGNNHLIYSAMMLSGAWLLVSVVSAAIRSRIIGRTIAWAAWIYVALAVLKIDDDVSRVMASIRIGPAESGFSLQKIAYGIVLFGILLWASFAFGGIAEKRINTIDELTPSLRVLIGKVVRILLIVIAVMTGLSMLNIDLTALTVLSGAIGVGLGFGLQKVVSNFISGIIILMDESIKPGDTITLGETFGWIRELRARFVSVVTRDGREFLIPNEDFITTQVINWSFSDRYVRLDVPFGVAYSSDPHQVTKLAIEAAASVDRVSAAGKPPVCWMTEFGDSSLNFLLRFWIDDPQKGLTNIRGTVLLALWDAFREHGVDIPFPHREVIMRTPVDVNISEEAAPEA